METTQTNSTQAVKPIRDHKQILKSYFQSFSEAHLSATKGGSGTSLTEIKEAFTRYLESNNAAVSELSNIQMGLLMNQSDKLFVRRKTSKGAYYLVSVITPIT